ncbi:MAG: hypothetical protein FJ398_01690 [Verrucomicrobia bacterium]|nr:hypothetical protein [Verrucomicrobiota bacterium]
MKKLLTATGWRAGFIYGLLAVVLVYADVPLALQAFIVIGVTAVGAAAGYLIALLVCSGAPEEDR